MSRVLLLGGMQKKNIKEEWSGYSKGVAITFDWKNQVVIDRFEYETPPEYRVETEASSILFKSGSIISNNMALVCTQTEILFFDFIKGCVEKRLSLPFMNDVHHAIELSNGNIAIVSTGLDAVFEVDRGGQTINAWSVASESIWDRFDRNIDYRKVLTTKPHHSHPNFLFEYQGDLWVTRFHQKDAVNLYTGVKLPTMPGNPHDGVIVDTNVFFTTTDGKIVCYDLSKKIICSIVNLNDFYKGNKDVGWCRSILPESNRFALVGFSRIRPTKIQENILWLKRKITDGYQGSYPTRISCFNFEDSNIEWEYELETLGINAIFSILKLP